MKFIEGIFIFGCIFLPMMVEQCSYQRYPGYCTILATKWLLGWIVGGLLTLAIAHYFLGG